jgi:hypothetical protein
MDQKSVIAAGAASVLIGFSASTLVRLYGWKVSALFFTVFVSGLAIFYGYRKTGLTPLFNMVERFSKRPLSFLRSKIAGLLQYVDLKVRQFISEIFDGINFDRKSVYVLITAVSVFAFHFWVQWRYKFRYIRMEGGLAIIKMFNFYLEHGLSGIFSHGFQINNYTGNPLFLLPVVEMFGYSPNSVRIALIASFAASSMLMFLSYYTVFDFKKAVLGIAILFTMSEYLYYRWFDYTYTIFLVTVLFYLYVRWNDSGKNMESLYLYPMSFLGGVFFYFKTTVVYLLIGFTAATFYSKGKEVLRANLPVLIVIFLIGAAPFFLYNFSNIDYIEDSGAESNNPSIGGKGNMSFAEAFVARADQLGRWMRSDTYNMKRFDLNASKNEYYGYNFDKFFPPGSEINQPLTLNSIITGENYNQAPFTGFHPFSILLVLSILALIYTRKHIEYLIIFFTFIFMLIFLPDRSPLRLGHVSVVVPFVPLIYLAALDTIPERWEKTKLYKTGYIAVLALLLTSIVMTLIVLPPAGDPGDEEVAPLGIWGGDQGFYNEFEALGIEGKVFTNSYKIEVISQYFPETSSTYIIPEGTSYNELIQLPKTGGHDIGVGGKGFLLDELRGYSNITVMVRENLTCTPYEEFCGAPPEQLIERVSYNESDMKRVELDGIDYIIIRGVRIE